MPDAEVAPTMPASANGRSSSDPTLLTTQQLLREISNVAELLRAENNAAALEAAGTSAAIRVRLDDLQRQLSARGDATNDRFDIIEKQRVEQKQDNEKAVQAALLAAEKAVQAALLAQKEAVREQTAASALAISKSESSTAAQQSQQYATITAELKAVTDRLGEQGNRLTTIESVKLGAAENKTTQRLDLGSLMGLVAVVVAVVSFLLARGL